MMDSGVAAGFGGAGGMRWNYWEGPAVGQKERIAERRQAVLQGRRRRPGNAVIR